MPGRKSYTKREWVTVIALSSVNLASGLCISLQAPFYPQEAEKKGASATEYGLVFGIYELVAFISCPLFGKYMDTFGPKVLLNGGIITSGISCIIFGLLDMIESHGWFIGMSFLIRILESLGTAASCTATFSITAVVFPDAVATTVAILETFYGLGFIIGPTIGGYLFELGGYICPFATIGVFLLLVGLFIYFSLPLIDGRKQADKPLVKIFSVLRLPPVFLDLFAVTAMTISVGYLSAILEPHLRPFGLSPVSTGAMFIISGGTYAITAPLVGRLCDTVANPRLLIVGGSVLVVISLMLVGPVPYTPLEPALWLCIVGLIIHGFGYSCILISAFIDAIHSAIAFGLPDDINTYGIVSGMWASSFCLGGFIGPSVAGMLYDSVGFRPGTLFVIAVHVFLFATMALYMCYGKEIPKSGATAVPSDDKDAEAQELSDREMEDIPRSNNLVTQNGYEKVSQHCVELEKVD